ncbi:MAG: hypothetical protein H7144_17450 [Burkholderiales bacterium]|nr:hypothetical protein [Phycisphaerae bacterium]
MSARAETVEISSLRELAEYAAKSGNVVRMKPGVYSMSEYFSDDVAAEARRLVPKQATGRPPVWMLRFSGNDNQFDLRDVTIEIDTALYSKLAGGYRRLLFMPGERNTLQGLTVVHTGPQRGSGGNTFSVWGVGNTLENVTLHISGSTPYGYGDLLGKGGPTPVPLEKQSGMMVAGRDNTLKRCRVISRALGHLFYIQPQNQVTDNIRLEDCYAEGVVRSTADMLRETSGPLVDLKFGTIAENRDGRFLIVPGYMKSLTEDGFRTYSGTGRITLLNCTAINTRAGFEIAGPDDGAVGRTLIDGGNALGCERAYLIGSNTDVRRSRGDTTHGPLLYLRGGRDSDVELELTGEGSDFTVHALATIAGQGHRVRLFTRERARVAPSLPIMLGFAMPAHAEMASPIRPAAAKNIRLVNELPRNSVIRSAEATDCAVETTGASFTDEESRRPPGRPQTRPATRPAAADVPAEPVQAP